MSRFWKIVLLAIAVLILGVIGTVLLITRTPILTDRAVGYLNTSLARSAALQVSVGRITGDWIHRLSVHDVVVTEQGPSEYDTVAVIEEVAFEYRLAELLQAQPMVRRVSVYRPRVFLPNGSLNDWRRRIVHDVTGGPPRDTLPEFIVQAVSLSDGSVERDGSNGPLADQIVINLSVRRERGEWQVDLLPSIAQTVAWGTVSAEGNLVTRDGRWSADSVMVRSERSDCVLSGALDEWNLRARPLDLTDLNAIVTIGLNGRLTYDGTVKPATQDHGWMLDGRVTGDLEGYQLDNLKVRFEAARDAVVLEQIDGRIAGAYWRGDAWVDLDVSPKEWHCEGEVRHFNLTRYARGTLPSDLSGSVRIDGVGLTGDDLTLNAAVDLGSGHFDDIRFDAACGDMYVTTDSVVFADGFTLQLRSTELVGAGTVIYDSYLDVFANADCGDLRAWDDAIFIDSLAGRADGYIYLSGRTSDPDLSGVVYSDSLRTYDLTTGDFEGRFYVPRFLSDRSGTVEAHWGASSTWGVPTDSIDLEASLSGRKVDIIWGGWFSPYADVEGAGELDWSADTIPLRLFPLTVRWEGQDYAATDSITVVIDSLGFNLGAPAFQGPLGVLKAAGRIDYDNTMALDLDVERFRLEAFWRRFFPDIPIGGTVAMRGSVSGTFDSPRFSLEGAVSDLEYDERPFGDLDFALSYRDNRLRAERAHLENPDFRADVEGTFPIDLTFRPVERRVLDLPLEGRFTASGEVLDRLAAFQPDVLESIRGPFAISATLGGTPRAPRLSGDAHLRAGYIKALEIENPIEDVQVDLSLRQDTVLIERAEGVVREKNREGKVRVTGLLQIESYNRYTYDLVLEGRNVPARFEFEDFATTTDFDLTVKGSTPPLVAGRLEPQRVEDREPFDPEPPTRIEDTTLWDWDFVIDLPANYWIHNDLIEAEMSAELRLLRERGLVNLIGTTQIIRGKVYLLDKVGRISRGDLTFDDPNNPDPQLDIDVVFRIQQPQVNGATAGTSRDVIDLTLHVAGRASEPLIQPEAPYTEQDVLLLLTTNTTFATSGDPFADRLRFGATGLLFSELQRVMARKLGLETLEIESGADAADTRITVGMYTTPHLYLYGTTPISAAGEQEWGFEYRFSRHLFLEGNRTIDNLYRLNLHFNWDY